MIKPVNKVISVPSGIEIQEFKENPKYTLRDTFERTNIRTEYQNPQGIAPTYRSHSARLHTGHWMICGRGQEYWRR